MEQILSKALSVEKEAEVYLFGSMVTNRQNAESDIDIAIIIPDHWKTRDFLVQLYRLRPLSPWPLDLVVFKKTTFNEKSKIGGVCFDILNEGRLLSHSKGNAHD